MKESVDFGVNRTGAKYAPLLTQKMIDGQEEFLTKPLDTSITSSDLKQEYDRATGPLGTVPLPLTLKGVMTTGIHLVKGEHPEVLIDKLGERLAFERTGVRLYDALIIKCEAAENLENFDGSDLLGTLRLHQQEERDHFYLLQTTIERFGADPTAQTPCAVSSGIASLGIAQALNDPRTNVKQCAELILNVELMDNDAWDLLIQVAEDSELEDEVRDFKKARIQEDKHLQYMRRWVSHLHSKAA